MRARTSVSARGLRALFSLFALPALALGMYACGPDAPAPDADESAAIEAAPAAGSDGRVFFVEPEDGATVRSPVHLRFGAENLAIVPVPPEVPETVRPQAGHHHVGVNAECLPPGTVIPQASPWIHHGGGQTEMDMQLPPGRHRLTLQIGDDHHRTIEGLCSTISVEVVE